MSQESQSEAEEVEAQPVPAQEEPVAQEEAMSDVEEAPETGADNAGAAAAGDGAEAPPEAGDEPSVLASAEQLPTGEAEAAPEPNSEDEVAFSWQASEYAHHHKSNSWYAGLLALVAVLVVGAVLLHYWVEIAAFLAMGAAVFVYARKPPRTLLYELTPKGIKIDSKFYGYGEFRSFSVLQDTEWHAIDLEPTKRFSPRITVLFDTEDFDQIVGHLERHLPRDDQRPDVIDRLSRYLRF